MLTFQTRESKFSRENVHFLSILINEVFEMLE